MHRFLGIRTFYFFKKGLQLVVLNWFHQFISSPLNIISHENRLSICKKHFTTSLTLTIIKTKMSSEPQAISFSYLDFTVWSCSVLCLCCSRRTFSPTPRREGLKPRSTRKISLATIVPVSLSQHSCQPCTAGDACAILCSQGHWS